MHDDAFGHWLAGFIDGEGCFNIQRHTRGNYSCRFVLEVRIDDAPILRAACAFVGIGVVAEQDRGLKGRNAKWRVSSKADCLALIAFLDRYPLRAKKARDFAIWRETVFTWGAINNGTRGANDWDAMGRLKQMLADARVVEVA